MLWNTLDLDARTARIRFTISTRNQVFESPLSKTRGCFNPVSRVCHRREHQSFPDFIDAIEQTFPQLISVLSQSGFVNIFSYKREREREREREIYFLMHFMMKEKVSEVMKTSKLFDCLLVHLMKIKNVDSLKQ
ncbi:hypothetical protein Leryth_010156 [Lithospermum erythrorhizon]|nr:hypothetical protein Leryth_010156 [Lithospermum erythrorhizon]